MKTAAPKSPWYAVGDPWTLIQNGWEPDQNIYFETIFTQSNGYFGIRGYPEEVTPDLKSIGKAISPGFSPKSTRRP